MSDDKTVFIQPGGKPPAGGEDRTVMVPRPGARPATPAPATPQPAHAQVGAGAGVTPPPQAATSAADLAVSAGLNPLAAAASVLLTVSNKLQSTMEHRDIAGLQRQLIDEIKKFENSGRQQQVAPEQLLSARYLLCTMLDEIVLNTPWGANSRWAQHSLLSQFHNETGGGEKCFAVLTRMLEAPAQHLDVLELFYLCLGLGFQGKFKLDPRGRDHLEHISNTLYQTIKNYRGEFDPELSPDWQTQAASKRSLMQYIPLWVVTCCVLLLLLLTFSGFRLWLYQATEPATERLNSLLSADAASSQTTSKTEQNQ